MKITTVRESKNDKSIHISKPIIQNMSYIFLNNNGKNNINPIKDLFYPREWDDLGLSPKNWLKNDKNIPKYRFIRNKIVEICGDCLIFVINRSAGSHVRHSNNVKSPGIIQNGMRIYFRFAIILHISSGIDYGHYVLIMFDGKNYYIYYDMLCKRIIDNQIDYKQYNDFIEKNSIMFFYYPQESIDSSSDE